MGHISPDCHAWLKESRLEILPITEEVLVEGLKIKSLLGIEEDQYHAKGVDENDILIIACAKVHDHTLISNEAAQTTPQQNRKKLKIPAVCKEVKVECVDFTTFLKKLNPKIA